LHNQPINQSINHQVSVPIVGLVENMSYFTCGSCTEKHHPFGQGYTRELADMFGIDMYHELPIQGIISGT